MTRRPPLRTLVAALATVLLAGACGIGGLPTIPPITPPGPTPAPTHPGPTYPPGCPTSQPAALAADATRTVKIETAKGNIVIGIQGSLSPIATGNFVALVACGYYDNVVFHRVVKDFVIQGGDGQFGRAPDVITDIIGSGGPPYTIKDEPVTAAYKRGTVAMAKSSDPDSASSQFFIVLTDARAADLSATYQILGTVTAGMDVVDAIAAAADKEQPTEMVIMTRVTVSTP